MDDADLLLLPKPGIVRPKRHSLPPGDDDGIEELVADGNAYATVKGPRQADSLRFLRRGRRSFSMPYAYLPVLWWESPILLLLEYPSLHTVAVHGRQLDCLEQRIGDRRVTWLRESDPAATSGLGVVIRRIDIIHAYPSREEEAIGGAD
jgi:hypothetical protein